LNRETAGGRSRIVLGLRGQTGSEPATPSKQAIILLANDPVCVLQCETTLASTENRLRGANGDDTIPHKFRTNPPQLFT